MSEKNLKPSIKTSTTSKRSTESDTASGKNSWYKIGVSPLIRSDFEFHQIMDYYWGGPERRITGLTLRIIGVNAIALIFLLAGIIYLSQYQERLIETKLKTFEAEIQLVADALSEGALVVSEQSERTQARAMIVPERAENMILRFHANTGLRLIAFDQSGEMLADTDRLQSRAFLDSLFINNNKNHMQSVEILKTAGKAVLNALPKRKILPPYQIPQSTKASDFPNAAEAMLGETNLAAWKLEDGPIILTGAAPLHKQGKFAGVIMLSKNGRDIEAEVIDLWINIVQIFLVTILVTILLSIYLSGVIARPLRRLARAAESVRKGRSHSVEIPDLSDRHDEIGELSVVLREMTQALWDRMDSTESFAADVAHELKNPLTSLRSAVETAEIVKTPEDRQKLIDIIKHDIRRMDRLISDISKASRLDVELAREYFEKVELVSLLEEFVTRQKLTQNNGLAGQGNGGTKLKLAYEKRPIYVWGSENRYRQVFENLIANACSFSPAKGTISISIEISGKHVKVICDDEGPGIPESRMESIFQRFYTERPEHEAYGQHSGLGLSISKQILEAFGGEIYAENRQDEHNEVIGARFTVILNRA